MRAFPNNSPSMATNTGARILLAITVMDRPASLGGIRVYFTLP